LSRLVRQRLLIVCLGNICRSPMAEGALRSRLNEAGLGQLVEVDSAGLGNWHAGRPPDRRAIACAARHGVDISDLRARQLVDADYTRFDHCSAPTRTALHGRCARAPGATAATSLCSAGRLGENAQIPDPYTLNAGAFEHAGNS